MDKFTSRAITVCMLLMAFAAPLSIAATQTAWSLGLLFWIIRYFTVKPPPADLPRARDRSDVLMTLAVLAFVGLSFVSSVFSYEPRVSIGKMMSVSLVTIAYLVARNLKDKKTFQWMLGLLLLGCAVACIYTLAARAIGKNLKVTKLATESPLRIAGVEENDTILTAKGISINSPSDLGGVFAEYDGAGSIPVVVYRHEAINTYYVSIVPTTVYDENYFGIVEWSRGRDTRATGFYGHYTTFAEALVLLGSLAVALMIVVPGALFSKNRVILGALVVAIIASLFLSLTRASWLSFTISAVLITLIAASRRTVLICAAIAIPLFIGALLFLQQERHVSFFDSEDDSTTWRMRTWKEGFGVLTLNARHLLVGIGMDSIKTHAQDWGMFDNGRQAQGHMHNDYLQLAFERGVPTLIVWIAWMMFYLRLLWRSFRWRDFDWLERGLLIGAFGGTIGFLTSGIVHYNWGDSEVVMILYLMMGMSLAVIRTRELRDA